MKRLMILLVCLPFFAAAELPQHSPRPGGIAVLSLPASETSPGARPKVEFGGRPALVIRRDHGWVGLVGIPLSQEIGTTSINVELAGGETRELKFDVVDHA